MACRQRARLAVSILAGLLAISGWSALGWAQELPASATRGTLLDVPYVPQTSELCGGAALAMVLRYWGGQDVFAEDFASLVDRRTGGIPTNVLEAAARNRGWATVVTNGTAGSAVSGLQVVLDQGHPVIALIEAAPQVYHYIVVVALTDSVVVFHDPARAAFRVLARDVFDRAWSVTDRWMLIVSPPVSASDAPASAVRPAPATMGPDTCGALVAQSVEQARAGQLDDAERGLVAATVLCPGEASPWRELAGLRFTQSRWDEAARFASVALSLQPSDAYAWRLIATSRYLDRRWDDALIAWNQIDEPRTDLVAVQGATRTRWPVVTRLIGLQSRQLLTSDAFDRASRRLGALPSASATQLRFEPLGDGRATIHATVSERSMLPTSAMSLVVIGARTLILHEVRVDVAGPSGGGELWTAAGRWARGRPRVALRLATPVPNYFRGIISIDASWERESYDVSRRTPEDPVESVRRRRAGITLADWAPHQVRWQFGLALDHLATIDYVAADGALDRRLMGDRVALRASGGWWTPAGAGRPFSTGTISIAARSTRLTSTPLWSAMGAMAVASSTSPAIVWQGAGTGQGRDWLLRAHPLLNGDGAIAGETFGRRIAYASTEYERPILPAIPIRLSVAAFVDSARAWHAFGAASTDGWLVDAGMGLRIRTSAPVGLIRIDLAHGLGNGQFALSIGWGTAWPH